MARRICLEGNTCGGVLLFIFWLITLRSHHAGSNQDAARGQKAGD
jgi:hypothetical protein